MDVPTAGVAALLLCLASAPAALAAGPGAAPAAAPGEVTVVQALPGDDVDVVIDGKQVHTKAAVGQVVGPFELAAGAHEVTFTDSSGTLSVRSTLAVKPGSSSDVVLHRPAAPSGAPVVNSYTTPTDPIGPGKARVLVAHTATVAPADVQVDGKTVFTNIANGEYATADVPAGTHVVELLPTGAVTNPILGPLDLTVKEGTVTMVYAVGRPRNGSMDVILHSATLRPDGSVVPDTIRTGSAGFAAGVLVRPFGNG